MVKTISIVLLLLALVLSACQSAGTTTTTIEEFQTTPVETDQPAAPVVPSPTTGPNAASTDQVVAAQCTVVSSLVASEESLYPPVSDGDWIKGPETAEVTIIEYSDFQ
jgi:hypothetical protein